ncbi:TolC family protein [Xylophilus sp. ASV27]|uniref:TolC family protein n=1 Tax=Xylophilus sp. ASV27 TaxID=2795129 RepID=UPI001E2A1355|nr:TolC family protein [Xylophilus sp. ASV27]
MNPALPRKLALVQCERPALATCASATVRARPAMRRPALSFRFLLRLPLPAVAALVLAGCAAPPVPPLPQADLPAAWSVATAGVPAPDLRNWWKALNDPGLDALVDEALRQNLQLARARSQLRQARLLAGTDDARYLPVLSAGMRPVQDVSATDSYLHASLDAVWELGLFGARESRQRISRAQLDSAEQTEQAARVSVVAEVVRRYTELRAAQRQSALLQDMAVLDERAMALSGVRLRSRLAGPGEETQARLRQARTAAQRTVPQQAVVQAARALAVLTGRPAPAPEWLVAAPQPVLGAVAPAGVPADLLRVRPDIREAEAGVLKAAGESGLARAELYPRLSLGVSLLYAYNVTQNRRGSTDRVPGIGPIIDIPLFDWGRRQSQAHAQQEALDESLLAYRQAVLDAVSETEIALSLLEQQHQRAARLGEAEALLQRRIAASDTLVRLGLSSDFERLGEQREQLQAQLELADAQASRVLAFVALYKSLGGAPLPPAERPLAEARP